MNCSKQVRDRRREKLPGQATAMRRERRSFELSTSDNSSAAQKAKRGTRKMAGVLLVFL